MADVYEEFNDPEDLEENDDEIGALGSILSWDDEDDNDNSNNNTGSGNNANSSSNNNNNGGSGGGGGGIGSSSLLPSMLQQMSQQRDASAPPPDLVQFSTGKDGMPELSFLQYAGISAGDMMSSASAGGMPSGGMSQQQLNNQGNDSSGNNGNNTSTFQLPLPTPVSALGGAQQQQQQLPGSANNNNANASQLQQQLQQSQQGQFVITQQGLSANQLAQLLSLQQSAMAAQQQPQQQMQVPNVSQPQQQQQQLPFTADANAFLQQLQFAQLQQQFQAAQANAQVQCAMTAATEAANAQQQQQQQQSVATSTATSQLQEQLKLQFVQAQNQATSAAPVPATTQQQPQQKFSTKPPPAKRQKVSQSAKKSSGIAAAPKKPPPARPSAASSKATKTPDTATSSSQIVSASDTDGEASRKARKKSAPTLSAPPSPIPNQTDSSSIDMSAIDMSHMSTAEKAKVNRDRNREHARNTRLRKKAYLEKLKTTVDELCRERDTLVSERAGAANLLVEMHNTRTEVLMSFFALRSTNEKRRKLWASILDDSCFSCVMPVTPYRSFPSSEVQVSKCQRTVLGVDGMIADTTSLHVLFASLVDRSRFPLGKIDFRYTIVTEESVVAGNHMMARWVMTTTNAVQNGAKMEVSKQGMMCCRFNSAHKITSLELMFDVMAFMLQLKQATGTDGFSVIPNTVQTCQRTFDKPVVMTLAEPPYTIVQVNKLWEEMTGYTAEEVVGKASCGILQGAKTDRKNLEGMMEEIRYKRPTSATLVNFKKSGELFRNFLLLFPLSTDSRITHFLGISDHVDDGTVSVRTSGVSEAQPPTVSLPSAVVLAGLSSAQVPPVVSHGPISFSPPQPPFLNPQLSAPATVAPGTQPALSSNGSQRSKSS